MVGVAGDTGDDLGVACLNGARRAAEAVNAGRAAHRHVIEPARRQAEMLGQADRGVGRQREARDAQAVHLVLADSGAIDQLLQRAGDEPVRAADAETLIGNGDGDRDGNSLIICGAVCHCSQCPPPR